MTMPTDSQTNRGTAKPREHRALRDCLRAYRDEHQASATCNGKYPKDSCNCKLCKMAEKLLGGNQ